MTPHRIYDATYRSVYDFFKSHINGTDEETRIRTEEEMNNITLNYFVNIDTLGLVDIQEGSQMFVVGKMFKNLDRAKIYQNQKLIQQYKIDTRLGENISYDEYISMVIELNTLGEIYPEDLV